MTAPYFFFFFNDTATTEIYTLSLHDALPIYFVVSRLKLDMLLLHEGDLLNFLADLQEIQEIPLRSEEHTSELQSQSNLVCRLLLEKKKHRVRSHDSHRAFRGRTRRADRELTC